MFSRELLPRFWASTRLTFGCSRRYGPRAGGPGIVFEPRHADGGNAALEAAERGKAILREPRRKNSKYQKNGCALLGNGCSIPPHRKRASPSRKLFAWPKLVSARLARWAPTLRRRLPRYTKAAV